jgi:hypothetical protein
VRVGGRVYRSRISSAVARNASSSAAFGLSQKCTRHALSRRPSRMRCTDCGEIDSTPFSAAVRASSAQVQSDSERPARSGSSHASFTRCVATTGGKTGSSPRPALSWRPSRRFFTNRSPHLRTILRVLHTCRATDETLWPSASSSTILARTMSRCAMRWPRVRADSSVRSVADKSNRIGVLFTPATRYASPLRAEFLAGYFPPGPCT